MSWGTTSRLASLGLAGWITLGSAPCAEPAQPEIVRGWYGVTSINDLPQPVEVRVASLVPGTNRALELVFAPPRNCHLSARYSAARDGAYVFQVEDESCGPAIPPGAGVTLRLIQGLLKYELQRQDGSGLLEVGYLRPAR